MALYGYARVSTPKQSIESQIRNIRSAFPQIDPKNIFVDIWTGTNTNRKDWKRLINKVVPGDLIAIDSVSRMSRNADEGFLNYQELFHRGIILVFLKEPHINTEVYRKALQKQIALTGTKVDLILEGVNAYLMELAREQIRLAFEVSEKEVLDLQQRTREGLITAKSNGKTIGRKPSVTIESKKAKNAKKIIAKHSMDFGGTLTDKEIILLAGVCRNSYYKYKRELRLAELEKVVAQADADTTPGVDH